MTTALAFGTRDAKLLYHAGMIAAATGDRGRAGDLLGRGAGARRELRPAAAPGAPAIDPGGAVDDDDDAPPAAARLGPLVGLARRSSCRPSSPPTRSATSPSTTTRGSGSNPTASSSTWSSTRRRSRPSRRASTSTPTGTARLRRRGRRGPGDRLRGRSRRRSRWSSAGSASPLTLTAAGLSFPPGAGGLSTMRLVCEFEAAAGFADRGRHGDRRSATPSFPERLGWREIVVEGSGVTIAADDGQRSDGRRRRPA